MRKFPRILLLAAFALMLLGLNTFAQRGDADDDLGAAHDVAAGAGDALELLAIELRGAGRGGWQ